jgi:flagellar hook-associated protein 2
LTTISTTSASPSATTATTAAGTSGSVNGSGIAVTLGIGSGIDTTTMVSQLVAAARAGQEAGVNTRESNNSAQVSSLATISSTIDSFASSLKSLVTGGTLFTQPTFSSSAIQVSAIAGSRIPSTLSSTLQVKQLAQAQTIMSAPVSDTGGAIGTGTLTLKTAGGSFAITLDSSNDTMAGLAAQINKANAGVTASIVNDGTGSRLVLKGAVGAANSFSLTPGDGADAGLSAYSYDPAATSGNGMAAAQSAQDATLSLDGVTVTRPSNTISDLIPGVKLSLQSVMASPATIGASVPTDAISGSVNDFVSAYNAVKSTLDAATASGLNGGTAGPFSTNATIRGIMGQMAQLTSTALVSSGPIRTLADLGIRTQNDGTLSVDSTKLASVLASQPDAVANLFNPTQSVDNANVSIRSAMGSTPPGTYKLTNLVAGPPPSGMVNGVAMQVVSNRLIAPSSSGAGGLVLAVTTDTPSATLTVEPGLSGSLQSIRDNLRSATGPLAALSTTLSNQGTQISADKAKIEARLTTYQNQLTASFSTMNSRVSVLKSTQSYLEQQIKVWTNDTNS